MDETQRLLEGIGAGQSVVVLTQPAGMNPVAQVGVRVVLHTVGFLPGWQLGFQCNLRLGVRHLLFGEQVIEEGQNDRC
ncbi:hypothetical protein D3C84_1197540 [compost metagenome]